MNRKRSFSFLVIFILLFIIGLPVTSAESLFDSLAVGIEREIGYNSYRDVTSKKQVVKLPKAEEQRLEEMFSRLAQQSVRKKEIKYSLTVIKDDTVNAFATPGGYVFVNTGLLSFVKSDSELAGVLAHEIAHIDRRHSMQRLARTVGTTLLLTLIIDRSKSDRQEQLAKLGLVAVNLAQLGYSRDAEFQADEYGVKFMQRAGYNKKELLDFWRRIQNEGEELPSFLQLFSTHPPTSERIKRIEAM